MLFIDCASLVCLLHKEKHDAWKMMLGFAVNTGRALLICSGESDNEELFGILNLWIYFQVSSTWVIKATEKLHTQTGKVMTVTAMEWCPTELQRDTM